MINLKSILSIILLGSCIAAGAQKLPNVQPSTGLRVPANIKVDGKTTKWDNSFQAYNHATDVFYSIANDDDKLYLVIQATDKQIINKIIGGGVTFSIQKSGKKNDKDAVSITYPIFDAKDRPYVRGGGAGPGGGQVRVFSFGGPGGGGGGGADAVQTTKIIANPDAANPNAKTEGDSIMNVYNKKLDEKSKDIAVIGIPGLDTLISVYNEDGIRVAERFNTKMAYTYELSIDLKKLGLSVNDAAKFAYHIKVNAAKMGDNIKINIQGSPGAAADPAMQARIQQMMTQLSASSGGETTDFWGEYTLAKK